MSKIKICGLFRPEDVEYVNQTEPDYVGFIVNVPKSHRNLSIDQVNKLTQHLKKNILKVGVFVDEPLDNLVEIEKSFDILQLHGKEDEIYLEKLRKLLPKKEIWKAFSVKTEDEVEKALQFPGDKILLDYGKGDGISFDWSILENVQKPFILAGGITPENVGQAVARFQPEIIDVSSGVETEKRKDLQKIKKMIKEIRS